MNSTQRLANRLHEVILNGTWIANTNYKHQLEGLDWTVAVAKVKSLNTIAVLAQHIHYYIAGVKHAFESGTLEIRDQYSFDFPPIESQEQWNAFLNKFWTDTEGLIELIEKLPNSKLDQIFIDEKYGTYQRNIDAMIEHSYYHLGQIVLIKKLLA
ncbi:DUF1572 domain-containing protein [Meridianimaribacter flavus]